jgi:hypothetical protein
MNSVEESLVAEADVVAAEVERAEGQRFERLRIVARDGIAIAFYRRADVSRSEDATLLTVLLDEVSPGEWDGLNAIPNLRPGGSRAISMRPSERGDWVVAIYGSAPTGKTAALIVHDGEEHRVPVEDGVYALLLRVPREPAPTLTRPRFQ